MSKLDTKFKNSKNSDNKGNSKGFNSGSEPDTFGPGDGIVPSDNNNVIGGTPNPNGDKGKEYDKSMITPREPVLNAVSWPNNTKMNTKDYSTLSYTGDDAGDVAPANVPIGGTPRPNTIS